MLKFSFIASAISMIFIFAAPEEVKACDMYMNFETSSEAKAWRAVNDGVMGGLSSGGPRFENGHMVFQGIINTNGGGFSSIRSSVPKGALSDASGIKLRVKSDGRDYKLTLRSNAAWRGRRVSFQAPIPPSEAGEWAELFVSFSDLRGTIFGRNIRGAKFDKEAVVELGIILADGQDGPFRLDVDRIAMCNL